MSDLLRGYYDQPYFPGMGGPVVPPPVNATGATAGTPGTWTPAGCVVPSGLAQTIAWAVVASPATAWTVGQNVVCTDASAISWNGTAWVAGAAPLAEEATSVSQLADEPPPSPSAGNGGGGTAPRRRKASE
jgi:hypothetical protein